MKTLFVYYKLPVDQHASVKTRLQGMSEELLRRIPGLQVERMQRPEISPEGLETWMEVYRHPAGVSEEMMEHIEAAARNADMPQPRRTEVFISLK
jgi:hypothetical protein